MAFGTQVKKAMEERGMKPAELCKSSGLPSAYISQYLNKPDRDPQLSTAVKIAKALNVSLEYLAGMEDEITPFVGDPQMVTLIEAFSQLPYKGKMAIMEQLEFQLTKSKQEVSNNKISGVA